MNANISADYSEAKTDRGVAELCAKIDKLGADLGREIAESATRVVHWMVGLFLASMAIFFTAIAIALNNAVPSHAPSAQPVAPVIIQLSPQGVIIPPPAAPAAKPQP